MNTQHEELNSEHEELNPEIWKRLPVELYFIIKKLYLTDKRKSLKKKLDVPPKVTFYFGLH